MGGWSDFGWLLAGGDIHWGGGEPQVLSSMNHGLLQYHSNTTLHLFQRQLSNHVLCRSVNTLSCSSLQVWRLLPPLPLWVEGEMPFSASLWNGYTLTSNKWKTHGMPENVELEAQVLGLGKLIAKMLAPWSSTVESKPTDKTHRLFLSADTVWTLQLGLDTGHTGGLLW